MHKYIFLVFILLFTACSTKSINKIEEPFTTKEYEGVSKDAIFEAAKKVFIFADNKQFRIDSYRDHLEVFKTKMSHYFLFPLTHEDRWSLSVEEKDDISYAKLELIRITDFNEEKKEYLSKYNHELFWQRLDYLLGLNNEWAYCDSTKNLRGTLCDPLDMYNKSNPTKADIVKNILIKDRKKSKNLDEVNDDILNEDIDFVLDDVDILEDKEVNNKQVNDEKSLDEELDKEIEELDRKVNSNIDKTLDKIENNIKDEQYSKEE